MTCDDSFADVNDYNFKSLVRVDVSLMKNRGTKLTTYNLKESRSLEEAEEIEESGLKMNFISRCLMQKILPKPPDIKIL